MKLKRRLPLLLSLLIILSCLPITASAESFTLPQKMADSKGNTLCTYQISGKTLNIQTSTTQWFWPFSVSSNIQKQNLILAVRHCFTGAAEGITELVLNPLIESGTINTIQIHGSYYDSYAKEKVSLKDSYQFQRNNKGQVAQCRHKGINFTIQYDSQNQLTSISGIEDPKTDYDQPMKNEIKVSYQPNGVLKKVIINNWNEGAEIEFRFNTKGQMTWRSHGSMHGNPADYSYTYNKNHQLIQEMAKAEYQEPWTNFTLTYDKQGRLNTITDYDKTKFQLKY